jgi:hypothetical protein
MVQIISDNAILVDGSRVPSRGQQIYVAQQLACVMWIVVILMGLLLFTMTIILFVVLLSGLPWYIKSFTMLSFIAGIIFAIDGIKK